VDDVVVLALPRGGVAVGFEVARTLRVPMDVLVVRKLGVPGQEELAMGAVASGGIEFRDSTIIAALDLRGADIAAVIQRERAELERRERVYRRDRAAPAVQGATVIIVDDGIATGSTMRAAVHAVKLKHPRAIIVAAPVASTEAVDALRRYFKDITHCHVVIAAPHRHHRHGRRYAVHVELSVPGERLVITHEPHKHAQPGKRHLTKADEVEAPHQDIYVPVREVFDAARRRLEDYVRRRRGDVKHHRSPANNVRQDATGES
jgi:predicted phosphoribosyltransferase